jgi:hypothetical protein
MAVIFLGAIVALRRCVELRHRRALRRQPRREELPVPVAGDDVPPIAGEFVGEVLLPGLRWRRTLAFTSLSRPLAEPEGRPSTRSLVFRLDRVHLGYDICP